MVTVSLNSCRPDARLFQVAATYIGAIIGAGFASGQELLQFFAIHGNRGLVGVTMAGVIFAAMGVLIIVFCHQKSISSYSELVQKLFGPKLSMSLDIVITLILFVGLAVMVVGSGAIFEEQLNLNGNLGMFFTLIVVAVAIIAGAKGVLIINTILIPCLIVVVTFVSIFVIASPPQLSFMEVNIVTGSSKTLASVNWILATILYVSYNIILGIVILCSIKEVGVANGIAGTVLGGLVLGALGGIIVLALQVFFPQIKLFQIPMLFVSSQVSPEIKAVYAIVLWFAMVTTAVANAYGIVIRVVTSLKSKISYFKTVILVLILPLPLTQFSFSTLVGTLYPLFGYVGLLMISLILYKIIFEIFRTD